MFLVVPSLLGELSALGQDHPLHPRLMGHSLVLDRVETPVAGQQIRCPPEALLVRLQARAKLGALRGALRENLVTTDDAPVYLVDVLSCVRTPWACPACGG